MKARYEDYQILHMPVVSEKSYGARGQANQYTFRVSPDATKQQIKRAVEAVFEVEVEKVQVMNMPAKPKRRGLHAGKRPGYRKAVVRLKEGHTLETVEEA